MDALKELGRYVKAAQSGDTEARKRFPGWVAGLIEGGRLDSLVDHGSSVTVALASLGACHGWGRVSSDLKALIKERKREQKKKKFTVHKGGGEERPDIPFSYTRDGDVRPCLLNVHAITTGDHRLEGVVRRNEFTGNVEWRGEPMTDEYLRRYAMWLDSEYGMHATVPLAHEGLSAGADDAKYHPVQEYIESTEWDGVERVAGLFSDYANVKDSPLVRAISTRFMVSCVARVYEPGCKVDTVPVLQGVQGARKSTFVRTLASTQWFRDTDIKLDSKDTFQQIKGVWIYELSEFEKWQGRKAQEEIKGFVASPIDSYRAPYERCMVDQPRQVVFMATTNSMDFLQDPTGERRWWPMTVGRMEIEKLERDRDQLWAETLVLYRRGVQWYLTEEEEAALVEAQEAYQSHDPWEDLIEDWIAAEYSAWDGLRVTDLMTGIKLETAQQSKPSNKRVGQILARLGFVNGRLPKSRGRKRVWRREDDWAKDKE